MGKVVYRRAHPMFGDFGPRNSLDQSIYLLYQLPDGKWMAFCGCDFTDPMSLAEVWKIVLDELERFSPILFRAGEPWPYEPNIKDSDAIDMLWQTIGGQIMVVNILPEGMFSVAGVDFATREAAVRYAVEDLLPDEIFAASEEMVERFPKVASALVDPWE
jgi:hypothetical protein